MNEPVATWCFIRCNMRSWVNDRDKATLARIESEHVDETTGARKANGHQSPRTVTRKLLSNKYTEEHTNKLNPFREPSYVRSLQPGSAVLSMRAFARHARRPVSPAPNPGRSPGLGSRPRPGRCCGQHGHMV